MTATKRLIASRCKGWDESQHPRADDGKFGSGHGERAAALSKQHAEARAALEKYRADRVAAYRELKGQAEAALSKANEHFEAVQAEAYHVGWDTEAPEEQPFTDLESLIADYDPEGSAKDRFDQLKQIAATVKECQGIDQKVNEAEGMTAALKADNKERLAKIATSAKEALASLRAYAEHRREMRTIKETK